MATLLAYWDWIAEHDNDLRRVAYSMRREGPYNGEDALHDAYASLVDRIDLGKNPRSFILAKCKWLLSDYYRYPWRNHLELDEGVPMTGAVDDMAIASVLLGRACAAIAQLPADQQLVMWHRMMGRSQSEIAALCNMPIGTVKTRTRMALKELAA